MNNNIMGKLNYNQKYYHDGSLHQLRPRKKAFKTFILSNGIVVGLFQGERGSHPELDFVVKILRKGADECPEPPIHTYWVVDLMIKAHEYPNEIKEILEYFLSFYDSCVPFSSVEERNSYEPKTISFITKKYSNIDVSRTLPMDYIALIIEFFSLCEKQNEGAYMFKDLLCILKRYVDGTADYMKVIKASMPIKH